MEKKNHRCIKSKLLKNLLIVTCILYHIQIKNILNSKGFKLFWKWIQNIDNCLLAEFS